jgi:hypothetical protein
MEKYVRDRYTAEQSTRRKHCDCSTLWIDCAIKFLNHTLTHTHTHTYTHTPCTHKNMYTADQMLVPRCTGTDQAGKQAIWSLQQHKTANINSNQLSCKLTIGNTITYTQISCSPHPFSPHAHAHAHARTHGKSTHHAPCTRAIHHAPCTVYHAPCKPTHAWQKHAPSVPVQAHLPMQTGNGVSTNAPR